jgi:hypothetical protein
MVFPNLPDDIAPPVVPIPLDPITEPYVDWPSRRSVKPLLEILGKTRSTLDRGKLFVAECTQEELDAALATYNGDPEKYLLAPLRETRKKLIHDEAYKFVCGRYSVQQQQIFQSLLTESHIKGFVNRRAYIGQLLVWVKEVIAESITADTAIDSATTPEQIKEVSIDYEDFNNSDPLVTVKEALQLDATSMDDRLGW